jgi:hypothetical protein
MPLRTRNRLAGILLVLGILQFVAVFFLVSAYSGYSANLTVSYILYKSVYADISEGIVGFAVLLGTVAGRNRIGNSQYPLIGAALCAFLISIFNLTYGILHIFITAAFAAFGISAILMFNKRGTFRIASLALAGLSVSGWMLFAGGVGNGIAERVALFPLMIWVVLLGILLVRRSD